MSGGCAQLAAGPRALQSCGGRGAACLHVGRAGPGRGGRCAVSTSESASAVGRAVPPAAEQGAVPAAASPRTRAPAPRGSARPPGLRCWRPRRGRAGPERTSRPQPRSPSAATCAKADIEAVLSAHTGGSLPVSQSAVLAFVPCCHGRGQYKRCLHKRVLKPPGGGSSNLFGSPEDTTSSSRSHKMSSNIFGAAEGPQNLTKKTNPPGGKESGIFEEPSPLQARQRTNPPGGKTSDIFGSPVPANVVRAHPNKPKDSIVLKEEKAPQELKVAENNKLQVEDRVEKKEQPKEPEPKIDNHEPRLGPRPRSHNKVLNPPGGKSSIAFY